MSVAVWRPRTPSFLTVLLSIGIIVRDEAARQRLLQDLGSDTVSQILCVVLNFTILFDAHL